MPALRVAWILLVSVLVGGCIQDPPVEQTEAEALLAAYEPIQVRLVHLEIEETLPDLEATFRLYTLPESPLIRITEGEVEVLDHHAYWMFAHNDTVIVADYHLTSPIHDVYTQHVAVDERQGPPARINPGGLGAVIMAEHEGRARAWLGPYALGTFSRELSQGLPFAMEHAYNVSVHLLDQNGTPTIVETRASTTFRWHYHGVVTLAAAPMIEEIFADPEYLQDKIDRYPGILEPGGRFGEWAPMCGTMMKGFDPCMAPWKSYW